MGLTVSAMREGKNIPCNQSISRELLGHSTSGVELPASRREFPARSTARRPDPIKSNILFQATVVAFIAAHVCGLVCVPLAPKGTAILAGLNAVISLLVLFYAASRARTILTAVDWPYLGLIAFESLILIAAVGALRGSRSALICSSVAFGTHALAGIVAGFVAFGVKFTKLM